MKEQFYRLLSALMKVHPIPHAIFETTRIYLNFVSLFSVMKDNSSVFFSSKIIYSEQIESSKVKFLDF